MVLVHFLCRTGPVGYGNPTLTFSHHHDFIIFVGNIPRILFEFPDRFKLKTSLLARFVAPLSGRFTSQTSWLALQSSLLELLASFFSLPSTLTSFLGVLEPARGGEVLVLRIVLLPGDGAVIVIVRAILRRRCNATTTTPVVPVRKYPTKEEASIASK